MIKRVIALMLAGGAFMAVTACNTFEGVGKDVSSVGRTVSDAAK
ncbi:entericidin A/B family lipoprotein [Sphingomonas sp. Root710]|nr:entericidin A/B family lipoprotein [Sphingomonas sp. Root710]